MSKEKIEALRAELKQLVDEEKAAERQEKNAGIFAAYLRCKDAQYIKEVTNECYAVYRKITDVQLDTNHDRYTIYVTVLERVSVNLFVDDEQDHFGKKSKSWRSGADLETVEIASKHDKQFIQENDYPISEEEFLKARAFVVSLIKLQEEYFNTNIK